MALLDTGVQALAERLPKVISPKTHGIIDIASAGSFFLVGTLMMGGSKRAGISSMVCGAAQAGLLMVTDMPFGVARILSFETHGKIDAGFAGLVAMLPSMLGFSEQKKSWFFRAQGMNIAAVGSMTDFEATERAYRRRRAA